MRNTQKKVPAGWLVGSHSMRAVGLLSALIVMAEVLGLSHLQAAAQSTTQSGQSGAAAQKPPAAPSGNAQHGKAVYAAVGCYECHGRDGQGGAGTGPKLGPNPLPFAPFLYQLRSPRNEMPPYTAKVLSDSDVADIYAFLQSLPQPPKADSVALLK
jgi:mono/diheme cytochrome c family protein